MGRALAVSLLLALPGSSLANEPPQVTNVLAQQRPGTMLVDVTYDLDDPDGDVMTVWLRLSEDAGETFPISCVTVSGDVGPGVQSGTGKGIVWDAGVDYPDHVGDEYVVKVIASDGQSPAEMVLVPAGTFIMGDGVATCGTEEHQVTLTRDFYLSRHEVTNQDYLEAVQWAFDNGYVTATTASARDNLDGSTEELLDLDSQYSETHSEIQFDPASETFYLREVGYALQYAYPEGYDPSDHPVKEVTWYGSVRYCDWMSLREGLPRAYEHSGDWACNGGDPYGAAGYRLPTDAEWEYAAQFDDERIYPWGNENPDCGRANFHDNGFCVRWTSPVGNYPAGHSGLGLWDMAGNVWEWCNDWWVCSLGTSPVTDPVGPSSGTERLVRGGGWGNGDNYLPCASRGHLDPWYSLPSVGFRAARTVTP
jgi:formylglycine-generating enzyme required for sulfatase activity